MTSPPGRRRPLGAWFGAWFGRWPRWARVTAGAAMAALGVAVVSRPTTSLDLLALLIGVGLVLSGVIELLDRDDAAELGAPWRAVRAALWLVAGLVVLLWPGLTVRLVALVVGVGLVVGGVLAAAPGVRRRTSADARVAALALGAAQVVFGVLALAWPDITLLVVAVVFGARLIVAGLLAVWQATTRAVRRAETAPAARRSAVRRWTRTTAALAALVLALGAAIVSARLHDGSPVVDAFYAPPRGVPDEPGRLIRSERFTRDVPDDAVGWRILYTTTRGDGTAAVASALVVVPRGGDGPWPVVDWVHGTTGYAETCAPSLAVRPFESGAFFLLDEVIGHGWAVVATDYVGLGTRGPHPYLVGPDTAHAVLDAARAARELADARLGADDVVWGHSQGGGGALWTGALAADYAPDRRLDGVAALAPASDLPGLVANLPNVTGGSVFASFVAAAYTATYPDVTTRDYVRPGAEVTLRQMATRCLAEPGVLVSVLGALALSRDPDLFSREPTTGAFGRRLAENVPPAAGSAPLLLAQGGADGLVLRSVQDGYVDGLCAAGRQVDYRVYDGRDHVPLVEPDSPLVPDLLAWTRDRFAHRPAPAGCGTAAS